MKKIILPFLFLFGTFAIAQESQSIKSYEKFKFGVGFESMTYVGYDINASGNKFQLDAPIYRKFGASVGYVAMSSYDDFCDEIPVSVSEQHFVVGLNYVILDRSRWTIATLGALDIERTKYTEIDIPRLDVAPLQNEQTALEDHNSTEGFVEVLVGLEFGYQISDRFQLNYSSRLNSYGSFRNSLNLNYLFSLGDPKCKKQNAKL